jgi:putative membrane protein
VSEITARDRAERSVWALSMYALIRTAFSSERALLAWVRTSVSLYSFGFTIAKFGNYLEARDGDGAYVASTARVGLILVCLGILALGLGMIEHAKRVRRMRGMGMPRTSRISLPLMASGVLLVIGTATLIGIVPNLG